MASGRKAWQKPRQMREKTALLNDASQPTPYIARTRKGVIAKARAILKSSGDGSLSMRRLVELSEVSSKTIYEIFGSKDGVLRDLLFDELDTFERGLVHSAELDPIAKFFGTLDALVSFNYILPSYTKGIQRCTANIKDPHMHLLMERKFADIWLPHIIEMQAHSLISASLQALTFSLHLADLFVSVAQKNIVHDMARDEFAAHAGYSFSLACAGVASLEARTMFLSRLGEFEAVIAGDHPARVRDASTAGE